MERQQGVGPRIGRVERIGEFLEETNPGRLLALAHGTGSWTYHTDRPIYWTRTRASALSLSLIDIALEMTGNQLLATMQQHKMRCRGIMPTLGKALGTLTTVHNSTSAPALAVLTALKKGSMRSAGTAAAAARLHAVHCDSLDVPHIIMRSSQRRNYVSIAARSRAIHQVERAQGRANGCCSDLHACRRQQSAFL